MPSFHSLFGNGESDDDDDDIPIFVADPIPSFHVISSLDYHDEVVKLFTTYNVGEQQQPASTFTSTISSHAPSVRMSGCGASVDLLQPNHSKQIEGTGGVVWGCAPVLCTILSCSSCYTSTAICAAAASHSADGTSKSAPPMLDFSNKVVLELGAGTGALGLWIATKWPKATVLLTDLPETMNLLRDNIKANRLESR